MERPGQCRVEDALFAERAACEFDKIPARRPSTKESMLRRADMIRAFDRAPATD